MSLDLQSPIIVSVVVVNLVVALFFLYVLRRSTSVRSRPLWKLVVIYGMVSTVSVSAFFLYMPTLSVFNLSAGIFYLLVGSLRLRN